MSGGGGEQTVGYKYHLGMHMVLAHAPFDNISEIVIDSKTVWSGNCQGGSITISADNVFGGESREGGVSGEVEFLMGGVNQQRNAYLQSMLGEAIPAFKGVVSAILKQVYVGMNPYIKPWSFKAQRIHLRTDGSTQWYDEKAQIGSDMNPAHIIRECLTDKQWGVGYNDSDIDDDSFTLAADQLYEEQMGVSLLWDKSKSVSDFIELVLSHIQGSLYVSRYNGKFVLKLSRLDYVESELITLDESSVSKISNFKRAAVGDLINSVTVVYYDSSTGNDGSVTVQDIALIAQQGYTVSTTKQYPGFTTGDNAVRAASTELRALSNPLASATIYANRLASNLNIGDVFILSWPRYGISKIVMRVTSIELGSLGSNSIKIDAVEDVFATASSVHAAPPSTAWTSHLSDPTPCTHQLVYESTYWDIAQRMGDANAAALFETNGYVQAVGVKPVNDAIAATLYTKSSGSYLSAGRIDFCPSAVVQQSVGFTDTVIPISSGIDLDAVNLETYALLNNEIIAIEAVSFNSITVRRGCLDTVPAQHASGSRVYFASDFAVSDSFKYDFGNVASVKITPTTGRGTVDLGSATELTCGLVARQFKPYPAGNLRINHLPYPESISGELTIGWSHRDRLLQTALPIIGTLEGSIGPEANVTYEIDLYGDNGFVKSVTGLTGDVFVWVTESIDCGLDVGVLNNSVRIVLKTVRDSVYSLQEHDVTVNRTV